MVNVHANQNLRIRLMPQIKLEIKVQISLRSLQGTHVGGELIILRNVIDILLINNL